MKKLILILALILASGCSKGGGDSAIPVNQTATNSPPMWPVNPPTPPQPPAPEKCSENAECVQSCSLQHPFVTDSFLSSLCHGELTSSFCQIFISQNDMNKQLNSACVTLNTAQVLAHPEATNTSRICGNDSICLSYCGNVYPTQTASQIETTYNGSGAVYQKLFDNQLLISQSSACLSLHENNLFN